MVVYTIYEVKRFSDFSEDMIVNYSSGEWFESGRKALRELKRLNDNGNTVDYILTTEIRP